MLSTEKIRYSAILTFLLSVVLTSIAQPHYRIIDFAKLNNSVTQVNRIVRDKRGMMWFSTNDGLYRYDGYDFQNFKSRSGDGVNMQSSNINYMYNSSEGGFWCLVANRVFLFDTHSFRFVDVLSDYEQSAYSPNVKGGQGALKIKRLRALPCGMTWLFSEDGDILVLEDARPKESVRLIAEHEETSNITVVDDYKKRSWVLINSKTFLYNKGELKTFHQAFRQIITTSKGVWLITADGQPFVYIEKTQQLRPWKHPLVKSPIIGFNMLSSGHVALFTETGILLMTHDGKNVLPTSINYPVQKLMEDGNGHLWALSQDGTLSMCDMKCQKAEPISGIRTGKCNVMCDSHGSTWIFTAEGGAYYSQSGSPTSLVKYTEDDELKGDIFNTINDGQGGYWFIRNHQAYRLTFESPHYNQLPLRQQDQVRCIFMDNQKRIFVATRHDKSVTVFHAGQRLGWLAPDGHISSSPVSFNASIFSSWRAQDGTLWLGTKSEGIYRLRPRKDGSFQISHYTKENSASQGTLSDNEIYAFAPDHLGRLWIATQEGGVCCITDYRAETPQFVHAANGLDGWIQSKEIHAHALLVKDKTLFVGTNNGLFVANISSPRLSDITFRHHLREPDRASSLSSSNITDIMVTSDNRLLIATGDGGLNELLPPSVENSPSKTRGGLGALTLDTLSFRHYNKSTAFPTDITHNIVEYNKALWITAPNQLVELQAGKTETPNINIFLQREKPKFSSCRPLHVEEGRWIFGSENGAILIDLKKLNTSTFVPPLVITGVSKENSPIDPTLGQNDTIILTSRERDLTIWFSALDYNNTELVAYAYRMGEDHPWQYIGQNHSVSFSQMRPGKYKMTIRSTNSNGVWCDNERTITIIVTPNFWQTPWAGLLIFLLVASVAAVVLYTLLYIKRIKRQQHDTMEAYLALLSERSETASPASPTLTSHPSPNSPSKTRGGQGALTSNLSDGVSAPRETRGLEGSCRGGASPVTSSPLLRGFCPSGNEGTGGELAGGGASPVTSSPLLRGGAGGGASPEDEELMRRMMAYIEKNIGNSDVTIDDMASAAAVSRSGLHRKVKHLLGTSPMEFLREARIRKAAQMLRDTSKPVTEIAYLCGFSDPKYFSKCFKASTNKTPTEYRNSI